MKTSGIRKNAKNVSAGPHSFRHNLARKLVENETPLPTVVNILGHSNTETTSIYLRVDIDGLRQCALSLPEVQNAR